MKTLNANQFDWPTTLSITLIIKINYEHSYFVTITLYVNKISEILQTLLCKITVKIILSLK